MKLIGSTNHSHYIVIMLPYWKFCNFYFISDTFPHIKDIKEPEPIFDLSLTYKINLEKCEDFRINEEELINSL